MSRSASSEGYIQRLLGAVAGARGPGRRLLKVGAHGAPGKEETEVVFSAQMLTSVPGLRAGCMRVGRPGRADASQLSPLRDLCTKIFTTPVG